MQNANFSWLQVVVHCLGKVDCKIFLVTHLLTSSPRDCCQRWLGHVFLCCNFENIILVMWNVTNKCYATAYFFFFFRKMYFFAWETQLWFGQKRSFFMKKDCSGSNGISCLVSLTSHMHGVVLQCTCSLPKWVVHGVVLQCTCSLPKWVVIFCNQNRGRFV